MSAREHERAAAHSARLASQEQGQEEEPSRQRDEQRDEQQDEQQQQQQQQPVPKFSRYRSLRGRSAPLAPKTVHPALPINVNHHSPQGTGAQQNQNHVEATTENSIARSMSRYRRRPNSVTTSNDVTPKITKVAEPPPIEAAVPPLPSTLKSSGQQHANFAQKEKDEPPAASRGSSSSSKRHHPPGPVGVSNDLENLEMADYQTRPATANDPAQPRTMAERSDRDRQFWEQQDAVKHIREAARQEAETDRILAEQKMRDLERLQLQLANGREPAGRTKPRSPVIEKFVMLTRGRKSKDGLSPGRSPTSSSAGSVDYIHSTMDLPEVPKIPTGIEVGGKGIVPQTDAPISAVNTGDRVVTVRCKQHTFALPVTPETTPEDIIDATIKQMTFHTELSARRCVVLESYGSLGIERRIRRYEKIRETMNSWDRDSHNHLIVAMSDTPGGDRDLELSAVPDTEEPPRGDRFYMHHSNRPGKWNKRWITLMDNGQMMSSKKPETSGVDKDTVRLCHLSDYDIYRPTESQMRRHIKPPKKHCFVIKSQHKASMFMNAENYVQYFCTEDPKVAAYFLEMVFSWRSWYLVDRRPEPPPRISIPKIDDKPPQLTAPAATPTAGKASKHAPKKSINVASANGVSLRVSIDEEPYKLGEFEPLLDMKRFDKRLSHFGQDFVPVAPDVSTMPKLPAHLNKGPKEGPSELLLGDIKSASDAAFTGNGLLAGDYEERKAAQAAAAKDAKNNPFALDAPGPFTAGPSLLNQHSGTRNGQPESPSWFPSAIAHSAKTRDVSERARPSTSGGPVRRNSFSRARSASQSRPPLPPPLNQAQPRSRPGEPPYMPFQRLDDNPRFPHQRPGDKPHPSRARPENGPPPSRGRPDDMSRAPRPYHDDVPPPSRGRPEDMSHPSRPYHDDVPPPSRGRPDDMPRPPRQYPEDLSRPPRQRPDDLPLSPRPRPEEHPHPLGAHHPNSPTGSPTAPQPNRRQPPAPLINIEPAFVEPPQWVKKGRGVHAPEGMNHLVDLINVGPPKGPISSLEVPPRSLLRRGPDGAVPVRGGGMPAPNRGRGGLTRTRSKGSAPPASRATGDVPPLPPLPGRGEAGRGDMRGDRGRDGFRTSPPRGRGQPPFRGQPQFHGPRDGPPRDRELPAIPAGQTP